MTEAGININDTAYHLDIHKTTAYQTMNRFWQTGFAGDRPKSDRPKKKSPLEEHFILITSKRDRHFPANPVVERLETVSGRRESAKTARNRQRSLWRMVKILTFCPFQNIFIIGIAFHANEIKFCCNDAHKILY